MAKMVDPHTTVVVMYSPDGESGHTRELCSMYAPRAALSSTLSGEPRLVRLHRLNLKVAGDGSAADSPAAAHNIWKLLPHRELKLRAHNHRPRLDNRSYCKRCLRELKFMVVMCWLQRELMGLLKRELIKVLINSQVVCLSESQLVAPRQVKHAGIPLVALPQSELTGVAVVVVVPEDQLVAVIVVVPEPQVVVVLVRLAQDEVVVVRVAEAEVMAVPEAEPMVLAEVVVVLPQRQLRVLPVPEDQLVVRHRRSPRQETHS
uniref:Uncharacterized protein n=1 Tax=Arundo donax TaxID=35708 RepID=A0A0A9CRQ7_ARUDO